MVEVKHLFRRIYAHTLRIAIPSRITNNIRNCNATFGKYVDWLNYQTYASQWCQPGTDSAANIQALRTCQYALSELVDLGIEPEKLVLAANSGHDDLLKGKTRKWGLSPHQFLNLTQMYQQEMEAKSKQLRRVAVWSLELSEVN